MKGPGMVIAEVEQSQRLLCRSYGVVFFPTEPKSKVGIALATIEQRPLNGLRHPPEGETSGWYLWGGQELPTDPNFFDPLHAEHLSKRCPDLVKFLGLPPGYRFLLDGNYIDVWFDAGLLMI